MANQVRVGVGVTGARQAASEVDRLRDKFTRLQKTSAKGFAIGVGVAATNFALGALQGTLGAVGDVVREATDAFIDDERSQVQLRAAIRANVDAWDGNTKAIEGVLAARMKLGFSDDEQRDSLKGLVAAYGDVTKALEVERTAMDLARFSGVDLATASDVLIKVHAGNYRALKALGINTKDITNETQALAAVQKIATGQAEEFAGSLEGRLAVASTRSKEAMERLGQATAEFSADIEEAKAGGIEKFVIGLDTLVDGLNFSQQSLKRQNELQRIAIGLTPLLSKEQKDAANAALDQAAAQDQLANAMSDLSNFPGKLADDMGGALPKVRPFFAEIQDDLKDTAKKADDTRTAIKGLSDVLENQLFGDAINAGNLADLQKTHDELVKQRKAVQKGTPDWIILTGKIKENEQAQFDLQLQMKEKEGPKAVIDWLETQKKKFGDATGVLDALIARYRTMLSLQSRLAGAPLAGGIAFTGVGGRRAAGGPVSAGTPYVVGEKGPEVVIPNQSGTVIPHGASVGGTTVNINISGAIGWTPGTSEAFARQIEPIITRAMQRRGQLAGARAF